MAHQVMYEIDQKHQNIEFDPNQAQLRPQQEQID